MYYYIFDIKKCKKRSQVEAIKNYLIDLGISGEYTFISAAQSAEELTDLGLKKKYSTIVAVGSDDLINSVVNRMVGRSEAMGVIPLMASDSLCSLVGVNNWKEAADTLRFRKIKEVNVGKTADGKHFITFVQLGIRQQVELTVEFKDFIAQTYVKSMIISNYHPKIVKKYQDYLDILIEGSFEQNLVSKITSLFKNTQTEQENISVFRARSLRIFSKKSIPVNINGYTISKTPQLLEISDDLLRIIVAKRS